MCQMGSAHPRGSWKEAGEICQGCPYRGVVFRISAGAWAGRRLADRAGARLRQLGQKGLIVGAREGCRSSKQRWASQLMGYNIEGQQKPG